MPNQGQQHAAAALRKLINNPKLQDELRPLSDEQKLAKGGEVGGGNFTLEELRAEAIPVIESLEDNYNIPSDTISW